MYPNLNAEIARSGMLRRDLAKKVNMSDSALSLRMSGKIKFTFDEVLKIKQALKVDIPVEELFKKAE